MSANGQMKRTKEPGNNLNGESIGKLQALSALVARLKLAGNLGLSHGGDRDIYGTLGYPLEIKSEDLIKQWERQDFARAIVDRPVKKTWQGDVIITEPGEKDETKLEKEFKALDEKVGLKSNLMRVDKLANLGDYAILLLGFDDMQTKDDWPRPVENGKRKLMYVRPVSKDNANIVANENDPSNPRYGKPRLYEIDIETPEEADTSDKATTTSLKVHHTRVIHIAFDLLENDVEGNPIMKAAYNRLKDLEKLIGGSAEMFWRGARPGYHADAKENYSIDSDTEKDARKQLDEYEHNLRRFLTLEGIDINSLETQVADPTGHFKMQVQALSALTGIPVRILIGSERGELASSQDRDNFNKMIQSRREEEVEPSILRPLVDRLLQYEVLSQPVDEQVGYSVVWSELSKMSEKDRAEISVNDARALAEYVKQPMAEQMVPLEGFLKYFLKMDEDTTNQILEMSESELREKLRQEQEAFENEDDQPEPDEDE